MGAFPRVEIEPVTGETTSTAAARVIRAAILDGRFAPDQPLREVELARQLGISRTPVREALRLLQTDGLVNFTPNRGATVRSYTAADLEDVYNLRAALEGYAAQTAAEHITPAHLEELHQSCERYAQLRAVEDLPQLAEENLTFHHTILKAAGSDRLTTMVRQVTALPLIYRSYRTYSPEDRLTAEQHHRAVVAALEAREGDRARELLESHVLWARDLAIARTFR